MQTIRLPKKKDGPKTIKNEPKTIFMLLEITQEGKGEIEIFQSVPTDLKSYLIKSANPIVLMGVKFNIPVNYNEQDMWSVSRRALSGEPGLYTHNSYREDKTDVSPQPHLIEMARTLGDYMIPRSIV